MKLLTFIDNGGTPLITSARQQMEETALYNRFRVPGSLFGNLFLSAEGYRSLGFTDAQLEALFVEAESNGDVQSNFKAGMQRFGVQDFHDPAVDKWDEGYRAGRIDAMLLIADDDKEFLLRKAREFITEIGKFAKVLLVERGDAIRNEDDQPIEYFGYVDGRSQPLFLTTDFAISDENVVEKAGGRIDKWNPVEPIDIVLVDDLAAGAADCRGSYFVFRKLEQDVRRFKIREQALADTLGLEDDESERAGAMAVGRFEDGTPLTMSRTDGLVPAKENNFTYADDSSGLKCPFHAHIRKSNPRGDIPRTLNDPDAPAGESADDKAFRQSLNDDERKRRITRRGITYGEREKHPNRLQSLEDLPTKEVGLLFMCFQASIPKQFGFMQKQWINNPAFVTGINGGKSTGIDPVVAQVDRPIVTPGIPTADPLSWNKEWEDSTVPPPEVDFAFAQFVTLKGGEFFFAPSIPFLRRLTVPENIPQPPTPPAPPPSRPW